ncbi:MAG: zinc-ribbon domain-containing protein [Oscillospiraceae bacterium]|jgi:uncharacterized membrane protein YvbJ|nr:zinc-ribbon domain-containing protein [Oscillospiraceae bacterium]
MFCSKCGKQIDDEALTCPGCGCATDNYHYERRLQQVSYEQREAAPPVTIVNNNTVNATAYAVQRTRRHHNILFDLLMICITSGLWIIWMIFRPKYY